MESTVSNAFFLLLAGMVTVFLILSLVVLTGKVLINIVNRLSPASSKTDKSTSVIDPHVEQTLQLIVEKITKGKGQIERIEKI